MAQDRVDQKFHRLIGKRLKDIRWDHVNERIVFAFTDGTRTGYTLEGECCSDTEFIRLQVPEIEAGKDCIMEVRERETDVRERSTAYEVTFAFADGPEVVLSYRSVASAKGCGATGGYLHPISIHDEIPLDMKPRHGEVRT